MNIIKKTNGVVCTIVSTVILSFTFLSNALCQHEVPPQLIYLSKPHSNEKFGPSTDVLRSTFKKHYGSKTILVNWLYRPDINEKWKSQSQELSTSYWILDAWCPKNSNKFLYLAGITARGQTRIEKWEFIQQEILWSQPMNPPGGEPEWSRALPRVRRTELYSGSELTHICDLFGDPYDGRSLLLVNWESRSIYQMDTNTGSYQLLFDHTNCPEIINFRRIACKNHPTEGFIFFLSKYPTWVDHRKGFKRVVEGDIIHYIWDTVIFRDSNKDGIIENDSIEYLTADDWIAKNYHKQ